MNISELNEFELDRKTKSNVHVSKVLYLAWSYSETGIEANETVSENVLRLAIAECQEENLNK